MHIVQPKFSKFFRPKLTVSILFYPVQAKNEPENNIFPCKYITLSVLKS